MNTYSNYKQKYFDFFIDKFGFESDLTPLEIDFKKPWWQVLVAQKFKVLIVLFSVFLDNGFTLLVPLALAYALSSQSIDYLWYLLFAWAGVSVFRFITYRWELLLYGVSEYSVRKAANQFFLTVDPKYHTTKDSGQIISKVDRGVGGYERLLDVVLINLFPFFSRLLTIVFSLIWIDLRIGLLSALVLTILLVINTIITIFNSEAFEEGLIPLFDKSKSVELENLQQNQLIRSTFATPEQLQKSSFRFKKVTTAMMVQFQTFFVWNLLIRILYVLATIFITWLILDKINQGELSTEIAIGAIITFVN